MRVHADDDLSFTGYRQLNDLRHDSAWITSCVLYAHSAICLVVVVAFASYGVVWPVKENSDTLLHKTTRKGTNVQVKISILSSRPLDRRGQTGFIGFVTSRSGTFPVFSTNNGVKRLLWYLKGVLREKKRSIICFLLGKEMEVSLFFWPQCLLTFVRIL